MDEVCHDEALMERLAENLGDGVTRLKSIFLETLWDTPIHAYTLLPQPKHSFYDVTVNTCL